MQKLGRLLTAGLGVLSFTALLACPKKPLPTVDASPVATAEVPEVVVLAPLEEDAGLDASDASDGAKKGTGGSAIGNKIRGCCNQISAFARPMGNSPEGNTLKNLAGQCYGAASAVDKNPNAPEVAQLRAALAGKPIPGCGGF